MRHALVQEKPEQIELGHLLAEPSRNGLSQRPQDTPIGFEILRISAATSRADAVVDERDQKYLDISKEAADIYLLRRGDLLACRFNGNLSFVGRFALYLGQLERPQVYPDKLIRYRVNPVRILPSFARYALNSPSVRDSIESYCATTAGNIGISSADLKRVKIPVPSLETQTRIVRELDALHNKVNLANQIFSATEKAIDAVLPSILDKAFRGEL